MLTSDKLTTTILNNTEFLSFTLLLASTYLLLVVARKSEIANRINFETILIGGFIVYTSITGLYKDLLELLVFLVTAQVVFSILFSLSTKWFHSSMLNKHETPLLNNLFTVNQIVIYAITSIALLLELEILFLTTLPLIIIQLRLWGLISSLNEQGLKSAGKKASCSLQIIIFVVFWVQIATWL